MSIQHVNICRCVYTSGGNHGNACILRVAMATVVMVKVCSSVVKLQRSCLLRNTVLPHKRNIVHLATGNMVSNLGHQTVTTDCSPSCAILEPSCAILEIASKSTGPTVRNIFSYILTLSSHFILLVPFINLV